MSATDKSQTYELGTFTSSSLSTDGTITSTLHGDGTTTAGSVYQNQIAVYNIKVADGYWHLETYTQNKDSMIRGLGMTPMHFKSEKDNPLDFLREGAKVLFRIEKHRNLNGVETSVYIPYADNPNKEFHFIGYFHSDIETVEHPKASDNVASMCAAHKLSASQEKQFCADPVTSQELVTPKSSLIPPPSVAQYSDTDVKTANYLGALSCDQIRTMILSNKQIATYLPYTWKTAEARCKEAGADGAIHPSR